MPRPRPTAIGPTPPPPITTGCRPSASCACSPGWRHPRRRGTRAPAGRCSLTRCFARRFEMPARTCFSRGRRRNATAIPTRWASCWSRAAIDAVAVAILAFDDHIAELTPIRKSIRGPRERSRTPARPCRVAGRHVGVDNAAELGQEAVAHQLEDAAAMSGDLRFRAAPRGAPSGARASPASSAAISRL